MNSVLKHTGLLAFGLTFLLISCREEESVFIEGPKEESLEANSSVAAILQNTASKDGSYDNIIDNASCISLVLPVSVVVNDLVIIVDSPEDLQTIEDVFDEFDDDNDELTIGFPVTLILSDFTELVITNQDELEELANECAGENEIDDDIECVDIKYPVTASLFNSDNEVIDTIAFTNDKDLYEFIDDLKEEDFVNVNFPVSLILFNGSEVQVSNLQELENVLDNARDDCDEDDDNDFNDDDCDSCTTNQLSDILTACSDWRVDKLERNNQDLEDIYANYLFNFVNDGTLSAESGTDSFSGTWDPNGSGNSISVVINIPNLPDFNAVWGLHEIAQKGNESDADFRTGDDRLRFRSNCSGDLGRNN